MLHKELTLVDAGLGFNNNYIIFTPHPWQSSSESVSVHPDRFQSWLCGCESSAAAVWKVWCCQERILSGWAAAGSSLPQCDSLQRGDTVSPQCWITNVWCCGRCCDIVKRTECRWVAPLSVTPGGRWKQTGFIVQRAEPVSLLLMWETYPFCYKYIQ